MNLNAQNPKTVEDRKKKRHLLEADVLATIRRSLKTELSGIAPAEWPSETLEQLVESKITETTRIFEALTMSELENAFAMERYVDKTVAETRSEIHRRMEQADARK